MDKGVTNPLYGNYRAKVVENRDDEKFGRVLIWIPDLMPDVPDNNGIWARPANNPLGGRNIENEDDNHYMGTSYIPAKGSWVWCFFESGNINRPYYWGALDLENAKVLPENQLGTNYQDKWTIFKSHDGRAIVVSDDEDDARVEITGKKRELTNPPSGDTASVYKIDGNQTTILFDERDGMQKILIRTYQGDFFHIDIDERNLQAFFENDILLKSNGEIRITAGDDLHLKSISGDLLICSDGGEIDIKAAAGLYEQAGQNIHSKAAIDHFTEAGNNISQKAGCNLNADAGSMISEQGGSSQESQEAVCAQSANPQGERDT